MARHPVARRARPAPASHSARACRLVAGPAVQSAVYRRQLRAALWVSASGRRSARASALSFAPRAAWSVWVSAQLSGQASARPFPAHVAAPWAARQAALSEWALAPSFPAPGVAPSAIAPSSAQQAAGSAEPGVLAVQAASLLPAGRASGAEEAAEAEVPQASAALPQAGTAARAALAEVGAARVVSVAQPRAAAVARPSEGPRAAELSAVAWVCRRDLALPWALLAPLPAAPFAHAMASERSATL